MPRKPKRASHQPKKPKPYRATNRVGILNRYGEFWTPNTFDSSDAARQYLEKFWKGDTQVYLDGYKFVPVRVTVSALRRPD